MSIYTSTIEKMETELNVWDAQINFLEEKIENAGSDIKLQSAGELNELRAQQRAATEKLKDMKKAANEARDHVKGTADKIWDDLKAGIAKAHASIK